MDTENRVEFNPREPGGCIYRWSTCHQMYGMTTACVYRSHRLYDDPYTARSPYSSTVQCTPPAQVHGQSQVNLSNYHIHTRPHTQHTPRRITPPRIVTETPIRRRIVDMSPGLLAGLTRACEKSRGLFAEARDVPWTSRRLGSSLREVQGTFRRCVPFSGFLQWFTVRSAYSGNAVGVLPM